MRRESSLSSELKKKLVSVQNIIETAKIPMKNAWETALSGSNVDYSPLFLSISKVISQIDLKFCYLQNFHSNNQYSVASYVNYQREIKANLELSLALSSKVRNLQKGRFDLAYLFGRLNLYIN